MARRGGQSRELVRLSPFQFSLSISVVVILLAAAGMTGYYYGKRQIGHDAQVSPESQAQPAMEEDMKEEPAGTQTSVTFYSTLTKTRKDSPPATTAVPAPAQNAQSPAPVNAPVSDSGTTESVSTGGSVMLQVSSYRDEGSARKLLKELSSEGYTGSILEADLGERGIWYRVRVGPYNSGNEARAVLEKLRREKSLKGYIVK